MLLGGGGGGATDTGGVATALPRVDRGGVRYAAAAATPGPPREMVAGMLAMDWPAVERRR